MSVYNVGFTFEEAGRVAQSVGHMTRKSEALGSMLALATFTFVLLPLILGAIISYWRKYVHEVLVNRLGGLSLTRKSVASRYDRRCLPLT